MIHAAKIKRFLAWLELAIVRLAGHRECSRCDKLRRVGREVEYRPRDDSEPGKYCDPCAQERVSELEEAAEKDRQIREQLLAIAKEVEAELSAFKALTWPDMMKRLRRVIESAERSGPVE